MRRRSYTFDVVSSEENNHGNKDKNNSNNKTNTKGGEKKFRSAVLQSLIFFKKLHKQTSMHPDNDDVTQKETPVVVAQSSDIDTPENRRKKLHSKSMDRVFSPLVKRCLPKPRFSMSDVNTAKSFDSSLGSFDEDSANNLSGYPSDDERSLSGDGRRQMNAKSLANIIGGDHNTQHYFRKQYSHTNDRNVYHQVSDQLAHHQVSDQPVDEV